ncbi:MAG: hypothetical protein LBD18_07375 [Treponema sp.]|nr:hypothetical protein [Treponema sp.]
MALQTPKFYLTGSIEPKVRRARKSGFLRSIDRKNPQFEQALKTSKIQNRQSKLPPAAFLPLYLKPSGYRIISAGPSRKTWPQSF